MMRNFPSNDHSDAVTAFDVFGRIHAITRRKYANTEIQRRSIGHATLLTCSAKSLHEASVLRRSLRALNKVATFFCNFVPASLFFTPLVIAAVRLSAELMGEQSDKTSFTSSSRPLQALYASLHPLFAFAAFASNFVGMQVLFTLSASSFNSGFKYIAQTALSVSVLFPAGDRLIACICVYTQIHFVYTYLCVYVFAYFAANCVVSGSPSNILRIC